MVNVPWASPVAGAAEGIADGPDSCRKAVRLQVKRGAAVIKLTANPHTAATMSEHIDLDVSGILKRELSLDQAGDALVNCTIRTANGRYTCAEALGHREFVLTKLFRSA